jgi:hypothetical protein
VDKALLLGKGRAKTHGVRIWEVPPFANKRKGWVTLTFAGVKGGPPAELGIQGVEGAEDGLCLLSESLGVWCCIVPRFHIQISQ